MTPSALTIVSIGLLAPGLPGWSASQEVLRRAGPYSADQAMPPAVAACLPANERRRTTATIRLALHVAQEAIAAVGCEPAEISTVFASSGGDSAVLDQICQTLTQADRAVSPTHFHQSVHNTPAGYWAIATGCRQPSLSLGAYDGSFAVGLREAATLAWTEARPVLLVAYDLPLPPALMAQRPLLAPFGVALLLASAPDAHTPRLGQISSLTATGEAVSTLEDSELERLRQGNPAARGLPLLCAIAQQRAATLVLPVADLEDNLRVEFMP